MTGGLLKSVTLTGLAFSGGRINGDLPVAGLAGDVEAEFAGNEASAALGFVAGGAGALVLVVVEAGAGGGNVDCAVAKGERT